MTWTAISDDDVSADGEVKEPTGDTIVANGDHLFAASPRCGEHLDPNGARLVVARGTVAFSFGVSPSGGTSSIAAVVFADDAEDGDPNFNAAPRVYCTHCEEVTTGLDWVTAEVVCMPYVENGTLSATGFTPEFTATANTTGTVYGIMHWLAIGDPSSGE